MHYSVFATRMIIVVSDCFVRNLLRCKHAITCKNTKKRKQVIYIYKERKGGERERRDSLICVVNDTFVFSFYLEKGKTILRQRATV